MTTARYTHGHHPSVVVAHATRTAANSAAYLLPYLTPGMTVLDIGCGPGSITLDLASAVAPGEVVGIEPGPDVLEVARAAAAERGDRTTRFEQADVMDLPGPMAPSMSSTHTRSCSTSPIRWARCARCVAYAVPV